MKRKENPTFSLWTNKEQDQVVVLTAFKPKARINQNTTSQ